MERLEAHTQSQFLFEENYLFCSGFFHKSVFQKKADSRIVDGNIITSSCPKTAPEVAFRLLEILTTIEKAHQVREAMGF